MEPITVAELLPGYEPYHDKNVNPVYKAQVHTDGQGEISAFVKSIPDHELLMECVCALIGRALGLPIPKPLLVIAAPDSCPARHDIRKPLFGSEAIDHPSARRFVCPSGDIDPHLYQFFCAHLEQWKQLKEAALFDEQIANSDRNGGNYLFDGQQFYLIDHGLAFAGLFHNVISASQPVPDNLFLSILSSQDEVSRKRTQKQLRTPLAALGRVDIQQAYDHSLFNHYADDLSIGENMIEFYRQRIDHISDIMSQQLGIKPHDNLLDAYGTW